MTSLSANRATTLKAAFRACDVGPLVGQDLDRYYVDLSHVRKTEAIESVITRLDFLEPAEFCTILFTGHRGCGKSTELRRIQKQWQDDYRTIYLEADAEIDINDAEYTDLYLVIIKKVADELYKLGLKFDAQLLNNFESWFKEITQEDEASVEKSVTIETNAEAGWEIPFISKLLAKLQAQIKGSDKRKQTIRQTLQKDIGRLQADINLLLGDAFVKLRKQYPEYQKGFLIIFDNLDRVPPNVGHHLFFDYASQLQGLHCTTIYTAPISIVYSENNLSNAFDSPNIVPMVNIYEFERDRCDLVHNQVGLAAIARLIEQRVEIDAVFESQDLLFELAKASGGHVRQLMQMTAKSCLTAATRKRDKVMAEDVAYAIKQEQFNFERIIPTSHYPLLVEVCLNKDVSKDQIGRLMLFNISVFEYNGSSRWNYINPVVRQSNAFQEALKAAANP
jgi:histone H3/H4/energy-coupling factor transporter ATP-binding protein EcfA2